MDVPRQYNTNQRWQVFISVVCLSIQANDAWTFCQCWPGSKNHRVGKLIQLLCFDIHAILPPGIVPPALPISSPRSRSHARSSVTAVFTPWGLPPSSLLLAAHPGLPPNGSLCISTYPLKVNSPQSSWSHLSRMQTWSCHFPPCWPVTSSACTVLSGKAQTLKLSEVVLHYSPCAFQPYYPLCITQP